MGKYIGSWNDSSRTVIELSNFEISSVSFHWNKKCAFFYRTVSWTSRPLFFDVNWDFTSSDRLLFRFLLCQSCIGSTSFFHLIWRRFWFLEVRLPWTSGRFDSSFPKLALLFLDLLLNRRDFVIELIEFLKLSLVKAGQEIPHWCSILFNTLQQRSFVLFLSLKSL